MKNIYTWNKNGVAHLRMRQYSFIILVFFILFFTCKESRKTKELIEIKPQENNSIEIIRSDTLFLSLSPNMTETEFNNAKIKENKKRLQDEKFQILLNDQILDFSVYQNNKAIELYYSKFFSKKELINHYHQKLFKELFSLFSKKYTFHNYADFPNHINYDDSTKTYFYYNPENKEKDSLLKHLTEYGFGKTNYAVFNDSIKTIVIGFSTKKDDMLELLNTLERPIRKGFKNDNNEPLERVKIEYDDIKMFGFSVTIDYFLTKDFDSIKNIMTKDNDQFVNSLKAAIEKNEKNLKKLEKNKSEL